MKAHPISDAFARGKGAGAPSELVRTLVHDVLAAEVRGLSDQKSPRTIADLGEASLPSFPKLADAVATAPASESKTR